MAETSKKETTVLVIGTQHEYQRHQDSMPDREELRAKFKVLLRRVIEERSISHIAEEAGDDTEVWEHLKREEDATPPELAGLFGGTEVVDEPQSTIAKRIADDQPVHLTHIDIRPPNAEEMTIEERDEAMVSKTMELLGAATNILVICGESHRAGVEKRLKGQGLNVESFCFR